MTLHLDHPHSILYMSLHGSLQVIHWNHTYIKAAVNCPNLSAAVVEQMEKDSEVDGWVMALPKSLFRYYFSRCF